MIHSDRTVSARLQDIRADVEDVGKRLPFAGMDVGGLLSALERIEKDLRYVIQDIELQKTEVQ